MIYEYMGLANFVNLALAIYPTLQRHGLVPNLTNETLVRMTSEWQRNGAVTNTNAAVSRMPVELWLQIVNQLEPSDGFALVFAVGNQLSRLNNPPSKATLDRLRIWSRRSRKK